MLKRVALYIGVLVIIGGGALAYPATVRWWRIQMLPPAVDRTIAYAADVRPILEAHCYECHGDGRAKGGLNLDQRASVMLGGEKGYVVADGDGAHSELIHRIAGISDGGLMPPGSRRPLTAAEIGILRAWIDQGVVWEDAR